MLFIYLFVQIASTVTASKLTQKQNVLLNKLDQDFMTFSADHLKSYTSLKEYMNAKLNFLFVDDQI